MSLLSGNPGQGSFLDFLVSTFSSNVWWWVPLPFVVAFAMHSLMDSVLTPAKKESDEGGDSTKKKKPYAAREHGSRRRMDDMADDMAAVRFDDADSTGIPVPVAATASTKQVRAPKAVAVPVPAASRKQAEDDLLPGQAPLDFNIGDFTGRTVD
jgi:hypothetical protein